MLSKRNQVFAVIAIFLNAQTMSLLAQTSQPATAPAGAPNPPPMSDAELEQLVAPIALYPDPLVSQILMASTYPLEVVQADRFAKANPKLTGDALTKQLEAQPWDASVKSLVNFPTVLAMMSEKLDSTIKLGDALLDDQGRVMNSIQKLRLKAKDQGNLKTNDQQIVKVEAAPAPVASSSSSTTVYTPPPQVITIEPANPQVVYVPTYNPTVVYGTWPYPAYPPYTYYPPGYAAGAALVGFGVGVAVGAAWGYAWGNCNWGGGDVDIDYNKNTNINNNIDRSKYQQNRQANQADRQANRDTRQGDRQTNQSDRQGNRDTRQTDRQGNRDTRQADRGGGAGGGKWQHDPSHRQGVAYRDNSTNQRFGGADNRAVQSREAYRGRADSGRQQINNGAANQFRGQNAPSPGNRANAGGGQDRAGNRQAANPGQNRGSQSGFGNSASDRGGSNGASNRAGSSGASNRAGSSSRGSSGGFSGVGGGGNSTRSASQRGSSSRGSSGARSSGGSRGGGSRGGGGRGGGGRR